MSVYRNRPFVEFLEIHKEIDQIVEAFLQPMGSAIASSDGTWQPLIDIYETVDSFIVKIELAGLKPDEDIQVTLDGSVLVVKGERKDRTHTKKEHYHHAELNYGPFERRITLPNVIDEKVPPKAHYENGFLEIVLSKAEQPIPKKIVVDVK